MEKPFRGFEQKGFVEARKTLSNQEKETNSLTEHLDHLMHTGLYREAKNVGSAS